MTARNLLEGQTAIVTGAARGIGAAVAVADIGERASATRLDVSDENGWQQVVDDTLAETGRIDILVNNAGILAFATLEGTDPDLFRRLFEIGVCSKSM
jgi:3alpha(or 20beta)-hydroxysteroid dehydrogenase